MQMLLKKLGRSLFLLFFGLNLLGQENLPELGDASSSSISIDQEYKLGKLFVAQIRGSTPQYVDPLVLDYTEHLVYRLSEFSQLKDRRFEIILVDEKTINAFAAPGGIIGVNSGLFFHAENEGQLASVLTHELAHLSQRHYARRLQRQEDRSLANALIILASVALAAASSPEAIIAGTQVLSQQAMSYSRSNEQEADRIGFLNLVSSGYDPLSTTEFFEKLQQLSRLSGANELEFLRSHPLTKKRISDSASRATQIKKRQDYKDSLSFHLIREKVSLKFFKNSRQAVSQKRLNFRKSKSLRDKIINGYGLSLALSEDAKHDEALKLSREILRLDEENLILQTNLLEIHLKAENGLEALSLGQKLLALNPGNYPISMLYVQALMNTKEYDEAESILRGLSQERAFDPQIWYWLAEVQGLNKKIIGLHQSRAEYFFLTGRYDSSIEHLNFALELSGNNFQLTEMIRNNLERVFLTKEQLKQASSS